MKLASTTFLCDGAKCQSRYTTTADGPTGPYLDLVEAGWTVTRSPVSGWKHYCSLNCEESRR